MKKIFVLAAVAAVAVADGAEIDRLRLKAKTCKANPIDYKVGENIRFDFRLEGLKELPADMKTPLYVTWERTGDDGVKAAGTNEISLAKGFSLNTKLGKPGFVRYHAHLTDADFRRFQEARVTSWTKGITFQGGAGAETEKMELATKEPADFDAYWSRAKKELAAVPVKAALTEVTPAEQKEYRIYAAAVDCAGPRPVTGWLVVPIDAKEKSLKAVVQFHGYNGKNFPVPKIPSRGRQGAIYFSVNAHGYEMHGKDAAYYEEFSKKVNPLHRTYALNESEYDNPETTYFRYMAMRVMRAFDYVRTMKEWNGKDLEAEGGSQGGLQTMWAASLVDGLTAARPSVTWGCNIGNWRVPGCTALTRGWGIPNVPGAYYFDSALHAKRIPATCTVDITRLGLGDYTCPPRGVLLSYYLMKCPKTVNIVQGSTHGYVPSAPNQTFRLKCD